MPEVTLQSHRPDSELGHFVTITATALGEPRSVSARARTYHHCITRTGLFGLGMAARLDMCTDIDSARARKSCDPSARQVDGDQVGTDCQRLAAQVFAPGPECPHLRLGLPRHIKRRLINPAFKALPIRPETDSFTGLC